MMAATTVVNADATSAGPCVRAATCFSVGCRRGFLLLRKTTKRRVNGLRKRFLRNSPERFGANRRALRSGRGGAGASDAWCAYGAFSGGLGIGGVRRRRLRRLVPEEELFRRRLAGEPLRQLASDYGVAHTTLGRFFERPEAKGQLRQARQQLAAEQRALVARRSAERRLERD